MTIDKRIVGNNQALCFCEHVLLIKNRTDAKLHDILVSNASVINWYLRE